MLAVNDAAEELEVIRHDAAHLLAQALKASSLHAQFAPMVQQLKMVSMTLILGPGLTRMISSYRS